MHPLIILGIAIADMNTLSEKLLIDKTLDELIAWHMARASLLKRERRRRKRREKIITDL